MPPQPLLCVELIFEITNEQERPRLVNSGIPESSASAGTWRVRRAEQVVMLGVGFPGG